MKKVVYIKTRNEFTGGIEIAAFVKDENKIQEFVNKQSAKDNYLGHSIN
jgi:hypothetical protein